VVRHPTLPIIASCGKIWILPPYLFPFLWFPATPLFSFVKVSGGFGIVS
jgi:hypothetical protein